ncbi:hypothetical protein FOZ60_004706 [Perkinsus olseni]|uniref:Uncharacterized protein n=1 Tax=Perkinsus olseni TaxID=32597 RepID=A0A7J6NTH8_PEROL|nr:hypothetical protein FOZ60_004706 [Perkinsus olseni]
MHPALFLALVLQHVSGDIDNLRSQDPPALAVHGTGTTTSQDPYSKPTGRCFYGELEGCICPKGIEPVYTMKRIRGYDRVGSIVCTPRCSEDKDCPPPQHGFGVKAFCASNGRCLLSCSKASELLSEIPVCTASNVSATYTSPEVPEPVGLLPEVCYDEE